MYTLIYAYKSIYEIDNSVYEHTAVHGILVRTFINSVMYYLVYIICMIEHSFKVGYIIYLRIGIDVYSFACVSTYIHFCICTSVHIYMDTYP